jgi:hypothetical protein
MYVRRLTKSIALVLAVIAAAVFVSLAARALSTRSISVMARVGIDASRVADTQANPTHPTVPVGTIQVAAKAPDASGGLPWGLRLIQKRPLAACLQIGRVRDGRIGALGQDGSYGNDGRFHLIPLTQNFPCDRTDASGHLFVDIFEQKVAASAAVGGHGPGCIANQPPARVLRQHPFPHIATCPPRDLRDIAYGVLGPDAVSITYTIAGRPRTVPTGRDGAYIVVLPPTAQTCTREGPLGGRGCLLSSGETTAGQLESGVITAVSYRDGHVCRLPAPSAAGTLQASCPNAGYVHFPRYIPPTVTPAEAHTPLRVQFAVTRRICYLPDRNAFTQDLIPCPHAIPPGYRLGQSGQRTLLITVTFKARVAADNHHQVYEFSVGRVSGRGCAGGGGGVSGTSMIPIRVGQLARFQDQESPCPGSYEGVITYQPDGGDGRDTLSWDTPIYDGSVLVGRFRFTLR